MIYYIKSFIYEFKERMRENEREDNKNILFSLLLSSSLFH